MRELFLFFGILVMINQALGYDAPLVGLAQSNITPPVGYAHYRGVSTGINDSLYAKAIVFKNGEVSFALVVCDLLWVERELSSEVRRVIYQQTGIPYSNVIISATHTHTGPAYHFNILELNGAKRPVDHTNPLINGIPYEDWLPHQIAKSVVLAFECAESVVLETNVLSVNNLSFNRRFALLDGTVRTNPGMENSDLDFSVGTVDNTFSIILIRRISDGKALGCIANFGLHADTFGGDKFGADFPGYLNDYLQEYFGTQFVSVFANGPCGNINHIDFAGKRSRLTSSQIGKRLANKMLNHLNGFNAEDVQLGTAEEYVYAPLQTFTQPELSWSSSLPLDSIYPELPFLSLRRSVKIKSLQRLRESGEAIPPSNSGAPWTLPLLVQVFKISDDTAIVGMPGELFAEFGLKIRDSSPFRNTMIVELTHCHIAYVPTMTAFSQGGYEAINSRLAPGGGELLCETAISLLNKIADN